jgi:hypothetical protein
MNFIFGFPNLLLISTTEHGLRRDGSHQNWPYSYTATFNISKPAEYTAVAFALLRVPDDLSSNLGSETGYLDLYLSWFYWIRRRFQGNTMN